MRGWGRGISYPGPRDVWGPRRRSEIQKYIRMHHFEKKSSKFFYIEGPRKNVWGPAKMFPPALLWLSTGLVRESVGLLVASWQ